MAYTMYLTIYKIKKSTKFINYNNKQKIISKINTNKQQCFRFYILYYYLLLFVFVVYTEFI